MMLTSYTAQENDSKRIIALFKESKDEAYWEGDCQTNCQKFIGMCRRYRCSLESMMVVCCVGGTYGGGLEWWNHAYLIIHDGTQWLALDYDQGRTTDTPWDSIIPAKTHLARMLNTTDSVDIMRSCVQGTSYEGFLQNFRLFTPEQWLLIFKPVDGRIISLAYPYDADGFAGFKSLRDPNLNPELRKLLEVAYINFVEFDKFFDYPQSEGMSFYRGFDNYSLPVDSHDRLLSNARLHPRAVFDYLAGLKSVPYIQTRHQNKCGEERRYAKQVPATDHTVGLAVPEGAQPIGTRARI